VSYLLDTHVWLWWTAGSPRIDKRTRALFDKSRANIVVSAASAWEIAIKNKRGRLPLPDAVQRYVTDQLSRQGIGSLDVTVEHALATADLPTLHTDPFDRILIAQAICEGLTLVTADASVARYPVAQLFLK